MVIRSIGRGSIAEEAGLLIGDDVLSINGYRAHDVLDYTYYEGEEFLTMEVQRHGEILLFEIEKDFDDSLGATFEDLKISRCGNDCVFCFVDQNPKGMREPVYFRDGDYRFSFLYGHFVTLTNVGPKALERMIRLRMSPIYVSVHSTLLPVRMKLMGMKKDDDLLGKMRTLANGAIDMHTQIVLCPGINDGESLIKTVNDLWELRAHVKSLSIVPVGVTAHREGLMHLDPVTPEYANEIIDLVERWQKDRFKPAVKTNWMYPSDEFYITAGRDFPSRSFYDGFGQAENGVGLSRQFIDSFQRQSRYFPERLPTKKKITLATSVLASGFMRRIIQPRLQEIDGLEVHVEVITNKLFGSVVTVAGLLSGHCFYEALKDKNIGDLLVLPPDILNADGIFLDDTNPKWLEEKLGTKLHFFSQRWKEALNMLATINPRHGLDHKRRKTYLDNVTDGLVHQ